jgi:uncharacterized protein
MERRRLSLRPTDVIGSVAAVGAYWSRAALSVLLFLTLAAALLATPAAALKKQPLTFISSSGSHTVTVELADTDSTRATGLMFRRSIGPDEGMLFIYSDEQDLTMWMKNTYIPLDMIFVKRDGLISHIEANTEPFSERIIPSQGPVIGVIEMAGGSASRLGLKPGDRVKHPAFK